ncbi:ROK family protein [Nocardioides sp. dk4132]|uniref:ROK family transcriptional regulator n=1 Tax=unclassified Nocardioides TaxID=2615069 RepID=UPI0012957311|nr:MULTISPECIES: ROK family transcriptional regulator [unclassified Nocardioides]MQW74967.1 ROK family protein [Nocardioides sp. dk4132]QGA07849.1 ROK family protein [Nocardioides sp. dk884]
MQPSLDRRLLRLLRDEGPRTRSELARALGVSRTTVSAEIALLEGTGLVAPGPVAPSSGGRRSSTVGLGPAVRMAAVSLAESRVRATVVDATFAISRPVTRDRAREESPEDLCRLVVETVAQAVKEAPGSHGVLATGLAIAPGLPVHREDLVAGIEEVTGGAPVVVEQAARAMATGERHGGRARGIDDLVVLRLGATVSTATFMDGHLGRGSADLAGAIGHTRVDEFGPACAGCGSSGCLDSFVSVFAVTEQAAAAARSGRSAALARALTDGEVVPWAEVVAAVVGGDPVAVQIARDMGRRAGEAIAGLVAFANPSIVLVGGPGAALGPHLLNEMRGAMYRRAPAHVVAGTQVELGAPGDRAALLGVGLLAAEIALAARSVTSR